MTLRQRRIILAGLIVAMVLGALDQSIVNTALPRMASDLGGLTHLSWVVTAFMLTSTIATPLYGKLSDMYGRRPLFVASISIFFVASVFCGVAQSMGQLIAFRAVQGLGAGGLMTLSQTVIGDVIPPRERGKYQGWFSGSFAFASVAGPLIGGGLTEALSWRWVFYVNIPLCAVALLLILAGLRPTAKRVSHSVDYAGALLMAGAATAALLLFTWAGSIIAWGAPPTLALGLIALLLAAVFLWRECYAAEPLVDLALFKIRSFAIGAVTTGCMAFAMMGALVFLPLYFQLVLGFNPAEAGVMLLPQIALMIISSVLGGHLSARFGRPKPLMVIGIALEVTALNGLAILAFADASIPFFLVDLGILGLGMGIAMPNATAIVQNAVPGASMGMATATMAFLRSLGAALGVAVSAGVMASHLARKLASLNQIMDVRGLLENALTQMHSLSPPQHLALIAAYRNAIAHSFLIGGGVMVIALLLSISLRNTQQA